LWNKFLLLGGILLLSVETISKGGGQYQDFLERRDYWNIFMIGGEKCRRIIGTNPEFLSWL